MSDAYSVVDWLFNQFISLWSVIVSNWALSVTVLLCIFVNIFALIKGIYSK